MPDTLDGHPIPRDRITMFRHGHLCNAPFPESLSLRQKVLSGGQLRAVLQCLECGTNDILRAWMVNGKISDLPQFNQSIRDRQNLWVSGVMHDQRVALWAEKTQAYARYLASGPWRELRTRVLDRSPRCEAHLTGCTGAATQAHHKTYERIYREDLDDLVSVCRDCHERIHGVGQ
jgi:hypothetical protein